MAQVATQHPMRRYTPEEIEQLRQNWMGRSSDDICLHSRDMLGVAIKSETYQEGDQLICTNCTKPLCGAPTSIHGYCIKGWQHDGGHGTYRSLDTTSGINDPRVRPILRYSADDPKPNGEEGDK